MKKILALCLALIMCLAVFAGCEKDEAARLTKLRQESPEYFGLETFKGLEVYVSAIAPDVYRCYLMPGANRNYGFEDFVHMRGVSVEDMKLILSTYDIPKDEIAYLRYDDPASSYLILGEVNVAALFE